MNKQDILDMPAGRELDALVAEKVMGLTKEIVENNYKSILWKDGNGDIRAIENGDYRSFKPSTDIAAAWGVLNQFDEIEIGKSASYGDGRYVACIDSGLYVRCKTAPEAICKAALLAVLGGDTDG